MLATSAIRVLVLALLPAVLAQSVGGLSGGAADVSSYCLSNPTSAECSVTADVSANAAVKVLNGAHGVGASQRARMARTVKRDLAGTAAGNEANALGCSTGDLSVSCTGTVSVGGVVTGASARARARRDTKQLEFSSCPTGFKACSIGRSGSEAFECVGNWEECTA
ncbi:hypothetical protein RQP46_007233 [Phenoliferia psychrophenolica]